MRYFAALLFASLLFICSRSEAGYIVTLSHVGPDVVATGSGSINLTGLNFTSPGPSRRWSFRRVGL